MKRLLIILSICLFPLIVLAAVDTFDGVTGIDTWDGMTNVDTIDGQTIASGSIPISEVQTQAYNAEADGSVVASYGSSPTEGNLLVAVCRGTTAIENASISGWSLAHSALYNSGTGTAAIFYKIAAGAESSDVTIVWTDSTFTGLVIFEWTGIAAASPLDKVAKTDYVGAGESQSCGTTDTTTVAKELIIAGVVIGSDTTSQSWSESFTDELSLDNFGIYVGSKIVAATAAYTTTLSWTTSRISGGLMATFKGD